jgi:hypothetical protein
MVIGSYRGLPGVPKEWSGSYRELAGQKFESLKGWKGQHGMIVCVGSWSCARSADCKSAIHQIANLRYAI